MRRKGETHNHHEAGWKCKPDWQATRCSVEGMLKAAACLSMQLTWMRPPKRDVSPKRNTLPATGRLANEGREFASSGSRLLAIHILHSSIGERLMLLCCRRLLSLAVHISCRRRETAHLLGAQLHALHVLDDALALAGRQSPMHLPAHTTHGLWRPGCPMSLALHRSAWDRRATLCTRQQVTKHLGLC